MNYLKGNPAVWASLSNMTIHHFKEAQCINKMDKPV